MPWHLLAERGSPHAAGQAPLACPARVALQGKADLAKPGSAVELLQSRGCMCFENWSKHYLRPEVA